MPTPTEFPHTAWITFFREHNTIPKKINRPPADLKEDEDFYTDDGMHLIVKQVLMAHAFLVEAYPDKDDPPPLEDPADIVA